MTVLLLSLQFRAAAAYLAQDPGTKPYRLDAVHLTVALLHHQLLDIGGPDAGARGAIFRVKGFGQSLRAGCAAERATWSAIRLPGCGMPTERATVGP